MSIVENPEISIFLRKGIVHGHSPFEPTSMM